MALVGRGLALLANIYAQKVKGFPEKESRGAGERRSVQSAIFPWHLRQAMARTTTLPCNLCLGYVHESAGARETVDYSRFEDASNAHPAAARSREHSRVAREWAAIDF